MAFAVDPAIIKGIGIDHAASENLNPAGVFADVAAYPATDVAADIHLSRRFGEGEVGGAEPDFRMFTEHLLGKIHQGLLEVDKRYILVDVKPFNLVKDTVGPGRDRFVPENPAGEDHPDRRLCRLHRADLYGGGVGAQQDIRIPGNEEGILHIPGRMVGCEVKGGEIVPVIFDLRTVGNRIADPAKDLDNPVPHDRQRVPGAGIDTPRIQNAE